MLLCTIFSVLVFYLPWHHRWGFPGCIPEIDTPQLSRSGRPESFPPPETSSWPDSFSISPRRQELLDLETDETDEASNVKYFMSENGFIKVNSKNKKFSCVHPVGCCCSAGWGFLLTSPRSHQHQRSPSDNPDIFQRRRPARQEPAARHLISPWTDKDQRGLQKMVWVLKNKIQREWKKD